MSKETIKKLEKAMEGKSSYKDIIIENQQKQLDKYKKVLDKIKEYLKDEIKYWSDNISLEYSDRSVYYEEILNKINELERGEK